MPVPPWPGRRLCHRPESGRSTPSTRCGAHGLPSVAILPRPRPRQLAPLSSHGRRACVQGHPPARGGLTSRLTEEREPLQLPAGRFSEHAGSPPHTCPNPGPAPAPLPSAPSVPPKPSPSSSSTVRASSLNGPKSLSAFGERLPGGRKLLQPHAWPRPPRPPGLLGRVVCPAGSSFPPMPL